VEGVVRAPDAHSLLRRSRCLGPRRVRLPAEQGEITGFGVDGGQYCGLDAPDGGETPADCEKLNLCLVPGIRVCNCAADGCTVNLAPVIAVFGITFNVTLMGNSLDGTVAGLPGAPHVHLSR
jgi:hypothetical protein